MASLKVGFIGLGIMGGSMALNVAKRQFSLQVHDLRREAAEPHLKVGARWAVSIEDLAKDSDVVLTSLPGPREVRAVAARLINVMRPGTAWFDLSTNSPSVIRELHKEFAARNVSVLDAPVSGGPAGARSGKLALWVGGDKAVFERCRDVLDAMGDQVLYIGDIGAGSIAKLVHNCAGFAIQLVVAEVMTMGVKAGVEPLALWAAIRQGSLGRRRTFDRMGEQFLQGKYDPPNFALGLAHKDATLATELAREVGVSMRLASLTHAEMSDALGRGWDKRDSRTFLLLQQERAGVNFSVPKKDIEEVLRRDG
jgi:3-hydroxyisobutyrate dehydrogenase